MTPTPSEVVLLSTVRGESAEYGSGCGGGSGDGDGLDVGQIDISDGEGAGILSAPVSSDRHRRVQ